MEEGFTMGKGIRLFLNLVCALVICFGLCSLTAYAEENAGDSAEETSEEAPAPEPQESEEVEAETVDTVVKNAIQTQIEEAINSLPSPGDCYVTVDDGTYDGNITLQGDNLSKLGENTLYILADGSYTRNEYGEIDNTSISAGGSGSAKVNGDIYIDGLTVVLGGIYLSMGNKITVKDSSTTIYGTTKDDNLSVEADKDAIIKIETGEGADTISIESAVIDSESLWPFVSDTGSIEIDLTGGAGADVYEINSNVGGDLLQRSDTDTTNEDVTAITINGDTEDRLHLTGSLKKDMVDNSFHELTATGISADMTFILNKSADEHEINLVSDEGRKTKITSKSVGSFTDELENKSEVNFIPGVSAIQNKAFVDYVISLENTTATPITVDPSILADNLAHSFAQIKLGKAGKDVKIGNVTTNGMNLLIVGKTVKVMGNIDTGSGNVVIRAKDSDEYNFDISSMIPMPDSLENIVESAVPNNGKASVFSIKSTAAIDVEAGKTIKGNNVDLKASSKQSQPLVPEVSEALKGINFIAVKIGKAVVNLKGTIQAVGSVIGRAISEITTAASNENLAKWFIPIAAGVLLGEAGISVIGNITAKAIKLLSDSTVNLEVASTVGSLPISIAVAGIENDSKVEVKGNAYLKAEQNLSMEATGKIKASTVSHAKNREKTDEKGEKKGEATADGDGADGAKTNGANTEDGQMADQSSNLYGGFIAVSVTIQNVIATALENARLESVSGSISVLAEALECVLTSAISYVPETANGAEGEESEADKDNGKAAGAEDTKSDKSDDDNSDKRSVENSKDSAASLLTAAGNTKEENQIGDRLDADDKDKIDNLKKGIVGDDKETSSEDGEEQQEGEENKEEEKKQDGIDTVFDEATKSADTEADTTATAKKSSNQLAGALAVNVLFNTAKAFIDTTKFVKAVAGTIMVVTNAFTYSKAVANASQVQGSQDAQDADVVVGATVSINIVNHENVAEIKQGNIEAKELVVSANSGSEDSPVTVHTEAVAGHTDKSEYGIAGAVAIDIASISTKALIGDKAQLVVKDDGLTVKSNSYEKIKTISTTNEEIGESNAQVGVGVAISVDICGVDTIAQIGSENAQTVVNSDIASMAIDAANKLVEDIEATAGATGKVGASPSVTVVVSGANTESYAYFKPATATINMSGDFEQDASNNVERTVSADAKAESQNGGSGALVVTVLNDSAYAKGKSDIKANNIKINARSKSILSKARARASSQGAMKNGGKTETGSDDSDAAAGDGEGDQDKQADEAIDGAKNLSKKVGTKNVNEDSIGKLTENRQKGQTSEGSVSVAAAFIVNIMSNESMAIFEVPVINAPDTTIEITSKNETSAYVFADSSSVAAKCDANGKVESGSSIGVGVAVAVNVINIKNEAHIKTNGDIKAKKIIVKATGATTKEFYMQEERYDSNSIKTYAVSGAGAGNVGVAGSAAIAVINGYVDAFIDCGRNTITATNGKQYYDDIDVFAYIFNDEETIASAALIDGAPDKNDKDENGNEKEATADSKKATGEDNDNKTDDGKKIAKINGDSEQSSGGTSNPKDETNPPKDSNNNPKNPNAKAGGNSSSVGVGASFAMNYSSIKTNAYVDAAKIDAQGNLNVNAKETLSRYTFAVAGTDPIAKGASTTMKTAVDAAVALLIESDEVNAFVKGQPHINAFTVRIEAIHEGGARNQASGFAVGNQSAIGAAVAFIWSDSKAHADFDGSIDANWMVYINAVTRDEDRSLALALSRGTTQDKAKPNGNDQPRTKNNNNKTAEKINTALNKTKSDSAEEEATNTKALSTNILKTQNVKTESTVITDKNSETGKAVTEAESTVNKEVTNKNQSGAGNNNISADKKGTEAKNVELAAAIGILIANHTAEASVAGTIKTNRVDVIINATNDASFSALGTAITMTQLPAAAAVALGVAVAYNKGEAIVKLADGININTVTDDGRGIIAITAEMKQNTNNNYCGAQAVSGSVANSKDANKTKVTVAGAVAILITDAKSQVIIGDGVTIKGDDIIITATDDYKLYVRAGSLSYSTKANAGIGISFGMLYANDKVSASIGRNAVIDGKSLTVEAVKLHENQLAGQGLKEYVSKAMEVYDGISSNKTVTASGEGSDRSVNVRDNDIKSIYTAQEATNIINLFIFDNYHVESFSGSATLGEGDFTGAGAVSFVLLKTDVNAVIGENANIYLISNPKTFYDNSEIQRGVNVNASDKADVGIYTIGVAVGNANNNAGASIAVLIDHSNVNAEIEDKVKILTEEGGLLKVTAETEQNNLIVSVASAISGGSSGNTAIGGNVNVLVTDHNTKAQIHDGADVNVDLDIDINADYINNTILVAAGVQGGKTRTAAAGGTVVVGIYRSDTEALVGSEQGANKTSLHSRNGNVNVKAESVEKAVSVLASASAAIGSKAGVAAVIDVLISNSKTLAKIISYSVIYSERGDINVIASSDTKLTAVDAQVALATQGTAAGGIVAVGVFRRIVEATVAKGCRLSSGGGNILISAYGSDRILDILAAAAASTRNAIDGVIAVSVEENTIRAIVESNDAASSRIDAAGSLGISSYLDSDTMLIAAGLHVAKDAAVGGTISTVVLNNTIEAVADPYASLYSGGMKAMVIPSVTNGSKDKKRKIRGIAIDAGENSVFRLISAAGSASGKVGIQGVINTVVKSSKVHAYAREGNTLTARVGEGSTPSDSDVPLAIQVVANTNNDNINAAGSLSIGGNIGVGVSVVTFVNSAEVIAAIIDTLETNSKNGSIIVDANVTDKVFLIAITLDGGGTAAVGVAPNVLVYNNTVKAYITGNNRKVYALDTISVTSTANSDVSMLAAVVSAAGQVAVSLEGNVIYFNNNSEAYLGTGVVVTSDSGDVIIRSITKENLNGGAMGISASGTAAVGGSADVVITNINSYAYTGSSVTINSGRNTSIEAIDEYGFIGIAGTASVGGEGAVGISVIVSVSHNTIKAEVGESNTINSARDINVEAKSARNYGAFAASIGISGFLGIGGGVVVIVEGKGIDKDSYDNFYNTRGGIHPEDVVSNGYAVSDSRAAKAYSPNDLNKEITSSITPNKDSAKTVADTGANGGSYSNYSNDGNNTELNKSIVDNTSSKLSGKIDDTSDVNRAYVGGKTLLNAGRNINVISAENVSALVITGAVAAGIGAAGVGAGVSVVLITSNVEAQVDMYAHLKAVRGINVEAILSHERGNFDISKLKWSNKYRNSTISAKASDSQLLANNKEKDRKGSITPLSDYGIFIVSVAASAGFVGVGTNVAYYNDSANVQARVKGTLEVDSGNANITASTDLGDVGVFNVSLSAGFVAVSVSVAISTNEAKVLSSLEHYLNQENVLNNGSLYIKAINKGNFLTINGAFAAGGVAVSPIVSITNNRLDSMARVSESVKIKAKKVNISSTIDGALEAYLGNIALGGGSVNVTVVIANNRAKNTAKIESINALLPVSVLHTRVIADTLTITAKVNNDVNVYGLSVGGGGIAVNGVVVLAINDAENTASISDADVNIENDIEVFAGMAGSTKVVVGTVTAGGIGAGAVVAVADHHGINTAKVELSRNFTLNAKNLRVEAAGLTKNSDFDTEAVAIAATGAAGLLAVAINFVYANNNATNQALVTTYGIITVKNNTSILATGKSKAFAVSAAGTTGAVTGNVSCVKAILAGTNKANLIGEYSSEFTTGSLDILSTSNDINTKPSDIIFKVLENNLTIRPDAAAFAKIYAGNISGYAKTVNSVNAKSDMTVTSSATFKGKKVQIGTEKERLNVNICTNGASTATTRADETIYVFTTGGVVLANAEAAGIYKATWYNTTLNNTLIRVGGINIVNNFASKAQTLLRPCDGGLNLVFIKKKSFEATAEAKSTGEASVTGDFGADEGNNISVISTGSLVEAVAYIEGAHFSLSGINVIANTATSKVKVNNSAFLEGLSRSTSAKNVTIIAKLNNVKSTARGGSNLGGKIISGLQIDDSYVIATADVNNNAYIKDAKILAAGAVSVCADVGRLSDNNTQSIEKVVHVEAKTDAPDYSYGGGIVNTILAKTDAVSTVTAKVIGSSNITANQISVISDDGTEVSSTGSIPLQTVMAASGATVYALTDAAKSKARNVISEVGENVTLITKGLDINVVALSDLSISTYLNRVSNYNLIRIDNYNITTYVGETNTKAIVSGKLISNGDVEILAQENINSYIDKIQVANTGFISYLESRVDGRINSQNVSVIIGNGKSCLIEAPYGTITVQAATSGNMSNQIENDTKVVGSMSDLYAYHSYKRNTSVEIKDNTSILSKGFLNLIAHGKMVKISTIAIGKTGSFASKANPSAYTYYNEDTYVKIGGGCDITSQYGDCNIFAYSESDLYSKTRYDITKGVVDINHAKSNVVGSPDATVIIAESGERTNIYGRNVNIGAYLITQKKVAEAEAYCKDVASDTKAVADVSGGGMAGILIGNANIIGVEEINIETNALQVEHRANSYVKIEGLTGKAIADSKVSAIIWGNIIIGLPLLAGGAKAALFGRKIFINNRLNDQNPIVSSEARAVGDTIVKAIANWIDETGESVKNYVEDWPYLSNKVVVGVVDFIGILKNLFEKATRSKLEATSKEEFDFFGTVDVNMDLYCGEYSAGINILVDEDKSTSVTGLDNPSNYISVDKDRITVHDIKRTKPGEFTLRCLESARGTINYYNSCYIPALNIDNYSDLPVYISKIFQTGDVNKDSNCVTYFTIPKGVQLINQIGQATRVEIISHGKGDVIFTTGKGDNGRSSYDDFDTGNGSIYIKMNGGNVYTEGNAFVVANSLTVEGAGKIGNTDNTNRFNLYMSTSAPVNNSSLKRDEDPASVSLDAKDSINVRITPVVLVFKEAKELLASARNFIISSIKAKNIILEIVNQYYTTMDKPSNGTGRGKNSIREFLSNGAEYDAQFWIDSVETDTLQVVAPAPRGNKTYYLNVANSGYKVNNLIQNLGDRVIWRIYNDKSELVVARWNTIIITQDYVISRERNSLNDKELKLEKEKEEKLPTLRHLRRGQKNTTAIEVGDEDTPLGFMGINSIAGILSKIMKVVDFAFVIKSNGVSGVIVAYDVSVSSIMLSINNKLVTANYDRIITLKDVLDFYVSKLNDMYYGLLNYIY